MNRRGSNYHAFDPYSGLNAIVNLQGEPMTRGGGETATTPIAVFHVTRWLSPFVNYAETFNPASADNVLLDSNLVPPTVARGRDYGTRIELFQGKLNLSLTYYSRVPPS